MPSLFQRTLSTLPYTEYERKKTEQVPIQLPNIARTLSDAIGIVVAVLVISELMASAGKVLRRFRRHGEKFIKGSDLCVLV